MLQGKWYFPSNGYGVFNGINDPGIPLLQQILQAMSIH